MPGAFQNGRLRPAHGFGTDLCRVEFRQAVGKPHDDFCGLFPIGSGPQIKIGNDLVERLQEEGNRLRIEVVGLAYNRAGDGSTGEPSTVPQ